MFFVCLQVFKSKDTLRRHEQRVHKMTESLYKCEECGKEFAQRDQLKMHEVSHLVDTKEEVADTKQGV